MYTVLFQFIKNDKATDERNRFDFYGAVNFECQLHEAVLVE